MVCRGEHRKLERVARAAGWSVSHTGGGHIVFKSPSGQSVYMAASPSDKRSWLNARATLRRAGLAV